MSEDLNTIVKTVFGENLKLARVQSGYSRAKLAEELNVSAKTIQSWETGRTFPENMSLIPPIEEKLRFFIPDELSRVVRAEMKKLEPKKVVSEIVRKAPASDVSNGNDN